MAAELSDIDNSTRGVALDQTSASFEVDLAQIAPDVVAHTAGPYQGQDYRVAKACIEIGCHYLDLADGREFVAGFSELNEAARSRGVLLVSGASTLPGVSTAVLNEVRDRFSQIESIETSIAPAHRTPRGAGTVAAVLSYCGRPFEVLTDGQWTDVHGWQDMRWQSYPALGSRLSGACDVPDLQLIPQLVEGVQTVAFHAALEAKWEQLALWLMAGMTRIGIPRSWHFAVPLFRKVSDALIRFGSDRGGMQMRFLGTAKDGKPLSVHWDLTALNNHGPEIPCVPLLILIRRLAAGTLDVRGAFPCNFLISLDEFDEEVSDLSIEWQLTEHRP